ncbi:MAG: FMN-binding protein [Eubacterium sp.]|nr:FMN-binding protein [Eubacterium sp.]
MSSEKKERSFVVDAIILCLITLILGGILAGVYTVTKKPIENAQAKTDNEACEVVLKAVEKVAAGMELKVADDAEDAAEKANKFLQEHVIDKSSAEGKVKEETGDSYSKHVVVSTVKKIQADGQDVGHVYIADAKKGYGGSISFVMGVCGGVVTGIEITNQSETAGLGANCTSDEFKSKFSFEKGIQYPSSDSLPMYFKAGTTPKDPQGQIEAMSGATVTSRAITNAVKGILLYDKEGGVQG